MPTFSQTGRHLRRKEQVHRTLPGSAYRVPAGLDLRESTRHTSSWAATRAYGCLRRANVRVALPWVGLRNALRSLARMSGLAAGQQWQRLNHRGSCASQQWEIPSAPKGSTYQPFNKQLSSRSPCSLTRRAKLSHTPSTYVESIQVCAGAEENQGWPQ